MLYQLSYLTIAGSTSNSEDPRATRGVREEQSQFTGRDSLQNRKSTGSGASEIFYQPVRTIANASADHDP